MASASGRYVITLNGEIYNHPTLRREMESDALTEWRGHSDTETLLALVERWGVNRALSAAVGMFAFALWDRQERQLVLARDRLGEKPLYYGWAGNALVFASELKALRAVPGFDETLDNGAVANYMRYGYVPGAASIYASVRKLPPG